PATAAPPRPSPRVPPTPGTSPPSCAPPSVHGRSHGPSRPPARGASTPAHREPSGSFLPRRLLLGLGEPRKGTCSVSVEGSPAPHSPRTPLFAAPGPAGIGMGGSPG